MFHLLRLVLLCMRLAPAPGCPGHELHLPAVRRPAPPPTPTPARLGVRRVCDLMVVPNRDKGHAAVQLLQRRVGPAGAKGTAATDTGAVLQRPLCNAPESVA